MWNNCVDEYEIKKGVISCPMKLNVSTDQRKTA